MSKDKRLVQMLLDPNVELTNVFKGKSALDVSMRRGTQRISEMILTKLYYDR